MHQSLTPTICQALGRNIHTNEYLSHSRGKKHHMVVARDLFLHVAKTVQDTCQGKKEKKVVIEPLEGYDLPSSGKANERGGKC